MTVIIHTSVQLQSKCSIWPLHTSFSLTGEKASSICIFQKVIFLTGKMGTWAFLLKPTQAFHFLTVLAQQSYNLDLFLPHHFIASYAPSLYRLLHHSFPKARGFERLGCKSGVCFKSHFMIYNATGPLKF